MRPFSGSPKFGYGPFAASKQNQLLNIRETQYSPTGGIWPDCSSAVSVIESPDVGPLAWYGRPLGCWPQALQRRRAMALFWCCALLTDHRRRHFS